MHGCRAMTCYPHSYPQVWMRCVYPEALQASCAATATPDGQAISAARAASLSSITGRNRSTRETALASKLTGFGAHDYSFPGDEFAEIGSAHNVRGGCDHCEWWAGSVPWYRPVTAECGRGSDRGLTRRTCVSTLEQSPERRRYGSDRLLAGDRAGYQQDAEVHRAYRVRRVRQAQRGSGVSGRRGARCNKESVPWPRASGPSSPTTDVGPGCTGFACGCVRARAGRSSRSGVARAGAR